MGYAGVYQLVEVVGQDLRRQTHRDAVGSLRQQQREFYGQRHGLLVAAVVRAHPLGGLLVENHVEREFRQTRLDVTSRGGIVAREDVAPVALTIDQQILLPQLHQRVLDRGVAVGVVLHGLTHDVGHLVVTAVVAALHGVENTTLHGLQTILDMGHGTLQNNIRSIVQEPVLVHAREFVQIALLAVDALELAPHARRDSLVDRQFVGADILFHILIL